MVLSYKERLNLLSLVHRGLRSDLVEVYKTMRGVDSYGLLFMVGESKTQGHRFRLRRETIKRQERDYCMERAARECGRCKYNYHVGKVNG